MLEILLLLALATGLSLFALGYMTRWAVSYFTRQVESRLRSADCIITEGRVPESWIHSYRQRIAAIRSRGGGSDEVEQLGFRAKQHCVRQINGLIRFFQSTAFFDSPETRDLMLRSLQQMRDRWVTEGWQALVDSELDVVESA